MNTKEPVPQVNPIVQAASDQVRKAKRRKAKVLPAGCECPGQPGLFDESEVKK
ncbi:hypothetical protein [Nocardia africana]|uniref:Uncharacterized protein n=1 Tax=Nocardia africana TaxID=134964 RepID=A0A378WIN0_9NOCA|nr:hypothetical protein [Nocardia africana]MCC3316507.1 hypothetical protein [Nocardia africana]SUA41136.1 Uncharacterised protein [Nocardia africana]